MKAFFQSQRSEWAVSYRDDEWVALYEVASSYTSAGFGGLNKWSDELKRPVRCEIVMCPILGIGSFLAASGHWDGLDAGLHATRATQRQSYEMPGAILGRGFILVQTAVDDLDGMGTGVQAEPRANRNGGNKRRQNTCLLLRCVRMTADSIEQPLTFPLWLVGSVMTGSHYSIEGYHRVLTELGIWWPWPP